MNTLVAPITIPDVTERDIENVERLLGVTFDPARHEALRRNGCGDVQACPGSGKTTLLVAKLAILAENWTEPHRGICVMSHTNVARREIETKLAATAVGQRLLNYPHFIGTIHGFVNRFLSLPWLRSRGIAIRFIDDDVAGDKCSQLLRSDSKYATARAFLQEKERRMPHRTITNLRFEGADLKLGSAAASELPCGAGTASHSQLTEIKDRVTRDGYWRHDDMFAIAEQFLRDNPGAVALARHRFPVVFIDEMQDTSEMQGRLLARVFAAEGCSLRQRFGDINQAIYDSGQSGATTDRFPCLHDTLQVPNSKRFGQAIATLADPLAHEPVVPTLDGEGPPPQWPPAVGEGMANTIFLFGPGKATTVLPAFAEMLLTSFSSADIGSGVFRAIGHRGRKADGSADEARSLHDYWPAYQPEAARSEPSPRTLADHFHLARHRRAQRQNAAESVEMIATGLVELLHLVSPGITRRRAGLHRWLQAKLERSRDQLLLYRDLVWRYSILGETIDRIGWPGEVERVRAIVSPLVGDGWSPEADEFCGWSEAMAEQSPGGTSSAPEASNVFRYERGGRSVGIEVGTIHGAKGQTHRGTLVLETYYKKHDLSDLLPWVSGGRRGWLQSDGKDRGDRLRLIFTAMTRPTHLLCLAMRRESLGPHLSQDATALALENRGWRLVEV